MAQLKNACTLQRSFSEFEFSVMLLLTALKDFCGHKIGNNEPVRLQEFIMC